MGIKIKVGLKPQIIPDGEYEVRVTDIRERHFAGKKRFLEFIFEVVTGEHAGNILRGFVNAHYESFSCHTKLFQWFAAVTKDADLNAELDTDVFLDKVLRVRVSAKESHKTSNAFSNVTEVLGKVSDL